MRQSSIFLLLIAAAAPGFGAEPDPSKKDLDIMQGAWTVESMLYNGKEIKDKYKISFTCKDNVMTVQGDGKVRKEYAKLALKLDSTTTPKCMDITVASGIQKNAEMEGLYELEGETRCESASRCSAGKIGRAKV